MQKILPLVLLLLLFPIVTAVEVEPNVTFQQGSYWYNTTGNFSVTNITVNEVDLYFDDVPVCDWSGFLTYLITNRPNCALSPQQRVLTPIVFLGYAVVALLIIYGVRLKDEGLFPLRLLLVSSGIALMVLFSWVAYKMAEQFPAPADQLVLLNTSFTVMVFMFGGLVVFIFLVLLGYSLFIRKQHLNKSIFD